MPAVEDIAYVEVAARTAASDFAADVAIGGGMGCRCGRGQGTTAEVVGSVDTACAGRPWGMSH